MLFFELIQVAIGAKDQLSYVPTDEEWIEVFETAQKQAVAGVAFLALEKLNSVGVKPPLYLLYEWIGLSEQIKNRNMFLNKRCAEITKICTDAGLKGCILKGQGNALMYPEPALRCPGDIDVWVNIDKEALYRFVRERFPEAQEGIKYIKFPLFTDVEVDMHYTPLFFLSHKYNRLLQQWLKEWQEEQLTHYVRLSETEIDVAVPTVKFNLVYQLGHIMIHLLDEGIGFRQLIDYYYVLKEAGSISQEECKQIVHTWRTLGLFRLASAIMWVESEILGLPEQCLLTTPNRQLGKSILKDVMEGGNFGLYSIRQTYCFEGKRLKRKVSTLSRVVRLLPCFPDEACSWIGQRLVSMTMSGWRNK